MKEKFGGFSLLFLHSNHSFFFKATHTLDYQECNGNGEMHNGTVATNGTVNNGNNNNTPTRVPLAVAEEDFQGNLEPTMVSLFLG